MQATQDKLADRIKQQQANLSQAIQEDSSSSDSELEEPEEIPMQ